MYAFSFVVGKQPTYNKLPDRPVKMVMSKAYVQNLILFFVILGILARLLPVLYRFFGFPIGLYFSFNLQIDISRLCFRLNILAGRLRPLPIRVCLLWHFLSYGCTVAVRIFITVRPFPDDRLKESWFVQMEILYSPHPIPLYRSESFLLIQYC